MMELLGIKLIYPTSAAIVAVAAIGVSLVSIMLHGKMVDRSKMDDVRKRVEEHQKQFLEAQKNNDTKRVAKLEREQEAIMKEVRQNMTASMKPTLITMPIVLLLIWFLGDQFGKVGPLMDLPFGIPFLTKAVADAGIVNGMDWFAVYLVCALTTSLSIELVFRKLWKRLKG
ncbi:MAG: DUF106 domain-containing protein [Candidatus Diapherotrites archaeon]|nr:DUF106 domain-containing protein [Candidatus Diapherotrites archaeon]